MKMGSVPVAFISLAGLCAVFGCSSSEGEQVDDGELGRAAQTASRKPAMVTVCHIPPDDPTARHTISIPAPTVSTHLAHGDVVGECPTVCASNEACNDGNSCTSDTCMPNGSCGHGVVSCDDGNACTTDSCDPASGCGHAAVDCDDGDPSTADSCVSTTGCVHKGPSVVIGESTVAITRSDACNSTADRSCESLVGNLITDAMRVTAGTDFAIIDTGVIRAALTCPTTDLSTDFCPAFTPPNYPITLGQVQTTLPFGHKVVTVQISGAELKVMLENGVSTMPTPSTRFAQVSGLCFTYDISVLFGPRVVGAVRQAADGTCTGDPLDLTAASSYSVAETSFMSMGGDGYPVVASPAFTHGSMDQVVADYIVATTPISPSIQHRISCITSGNVACPTLTP